MADFGNMVPFVLGEDTGVWDSAPAFQFLRLLTLLGVEQKSLANFLQVTTSSVSMWANGHRSIPAKYRPALRAYAETMLQKHVELQRKEVSTLPTTLQHAAIVAFGGILYRWRLEVEHATGVIHQTIQDACRQIGSYSGAASLSADERHRLMALCRTIQGELRKLEELETSPENNTEAPTSD